MEMEGFVGTPPVFGCKTRFQRLQDGRTKHARRGKSRRKKRGGGGRSEVVRGQEEGPARKVDSRDRRNVCSLTCERGEETESGHSQALVGVGASNLSSTVGDAERELRGETATSERVGVGGVILDEEADDHAVRDTRGGISHDSQIDCMRAHTHRVVMHPAHGEVRSMKSFHDMGRDVREIHFELMRFTPELHCVL
jgi:hypothetical protein